MTEIIAMDITGMDIFPAQSVLWIYKNDTLPVEDSYSKTTLSILKAYAKGGGCILLANQAMLLLKDLGLEKTVPQTRVKSSKDEGYGRQLGYHAFLSHPLFDGMNGGAYVLKPLKDTAVMQTGYFGETPGLRGKVVAVDWDYIFLREDNKMIMEYEYGKGKVLAIGGYMVFSAPNRNRIHLEKFASNVIAYLSDGSLSPEGHYWHAGPNKAIEKGFDIPEETGIIFSDSLKLRNAKPSVGPVESSGNFWDLAGERMLVMGVDSGGITEIWAHPVMSLRDFKVSYSLKVEDLRLKVEDLEMKPLDLLKPEIQVLSSAYQRQYLLQEGPKGPGLWETLTVSPDDPVAVIHYEYNGNDPIKLQFDFTLLFRLMWPYSEGVLGDMFYSWDESLNAVIASDQSGKFITIIGVNNKQLVYSHKFSGPDAQGLPGMASQKCSFGIGSSGPFQCDIVFVSTSEGIEKAISHYRDAVRSPKSIFLEATINADSLLQTSLKIAGPDPIFNQGYEWALLATDRFMVNTPGLGASLTAGYATSDNGWDGEHAVSGRPGYGWYFGRDGEWSGFAVLDYGDFENVRLMLSTFQRYQDLNGKIFHEMSTSGIVHYDAADATPLYVVLAGKYLRHSGDSAFIRRSWPFIQNAMDFCYSTDTDGDKLIENTNVGHGWVEGGHLFGSHTSLHLASCWAAALDEASYMANIIGKNDLAAKYRQDAVVVKAAISHRFWNPGNDYFYHGLMADGTFMESMSIMPAIPMLFGQTDAKQASKVLPVLASNAFTADWGCRIAPQNDPNYNPRGYHSGSVWPLFTGWAALAEFRYNNYLQGFSHLFSNMMIWQFWGLGFNEEVLNGETFEPGGVCHHQCWSETMALQPVIEGMLGYQPDALGKKLTLKPWFPADWDTVEVRNIRMGAERISMEIRTRGQGDKGMVSSFKLVKERPERLDVHFQPVLPPGAIVDRITVNSQPAREWETRPTAQGWVVADFGFWLDRMAVVEITWHGGITALPLLSHPQPGDRSVGFRILDTQFADSSYTITFQGPRASRQEFRVWAADPSKVITGDAEIIAIEGNIITLATTFADLETDYAVKEVVMQLKSSSIDR